MLFQRRIEFDPELEEVYDKVFKVNFSRLEFKTLIEDKAFIRELTANSSVCIFK